MSLTRGTIHSTPFISVLKVSNPALSDAKLLRLFFSVLMSAFSFLYLSFNYRCKESEIPLPISLPVRSIWFWSILIFVNVMGWLIIWSNCFLIFKTDFGSISACIFNLLIWFWIRSMDLLILPLDVSLSKIAWSYIKNSFIYIFLHLSCQ